MSPRFHAVLMMWLVGGLLLATDGPTTAECYAPLDRWPSFREVAPTARRVVVGTVMESLSSLGGLDPRPDPTHPAVRFRLRVDEVLRGSAPETIEVHGLRSGLPSTGSCRDGWLLYAMVEDQVAIAYGGKLPSVKGHVTTVAWIKGKPSRLTGRPERLTLRQVRRVAGHAPGGSTLPPAKGIRRPAIALTDTPNVAREIVLGLVRCLGDRLATDACRASLDDVSGLKVRAGRPTLTGAYRMTEGDFAAYLERLLAAQRINVHGARWDFPGSRDVCVVDGWFALPGVAGPETKAKRVAIFIWDDGPRLFSAAWRNKRQVPLVFDR